MKAEGDDIEAQILRFSEGWVWEGEREVEERVREFGGVEATGWRLTHRGH